jgi:hypothetical protein
LDRCLVNPSNPLQRLVVATGTGKATLYEPHRALSGLFVEFLLCIREWESPPFASSGHIEVPPFAVPIAM